MKSGSPNPRVRILIGNACAVKYCKNTQNIVRSPKIQLSSGNSIRRTVMIEDFRPEVEMPQFLRTRTERRPKHGQVLTNRRNNLSFIQKLRSSNLTATSNFDWAFSDSDSNRSYKCAVKSGQNHLKRCQLTKMSHKSWAWVRFIHGLDKTGLGRIILEFLWVG